MVGSSGLEPPTSRLSGVRSNHLSYEPITILKDGGGDERDRTDDPLLAKQVLSQLSYTPVSITFKKVHNEPQKLNNDSNLGPQRYFYRSDLGMLEQSISFVQVSIERR